MGQNEGKPWPLGLQERAAQLLGRRLTRIFTRRREGAGGRRAEGAGPQARDGQALGMGRSRRAVTTVTTANASEQNAGGLLREALGERIDIVKMSVIAATTLAAGWTDKCH